MTTSSNDYQNKPPDVFTSLTFFISKNRIPGMTDTDLLKIVVKKLSQQCNGCKNYSWNYIHQVSSRNKLPSKHLVKAIIKNNTIINST